MFTVSVADLGCLQVASQAPRHTNTDKNMYLGAPPHCLATLPCLPLPRPVFQVKFSISPGRWEPCKATRAPHAGMGPSPWMDTEDA